MSLVCAQSEHGNDVVCTKWFVDDDGTSTAVSVSWDRTLRLWRLDDCGGRPTLAAVLSGHSKQARSVSVCTLRGDVHLVSCGDDKNLFLWHVASRKCTQRLTGHTGRVFCLSSVFPWEDGTPCVASASEDKTVR